MSTFHGDSLSLSQPHRFSCHSRPLSPELRAIISRARKVCTREAEKFRNPAEACVFPASLLGESNPHLPLPVNLMSHPWQQISALQWLKELFFDQAPSVVVVPFLSKSREERLQAECRRRKFLIFFPSFTQF